MFVSLGMDKGKRITIYTDGSCNWRTRVGGLGVYIRYKDREFFYKKGYKNTTIDRCELRAILYAITFVKVDCRCTVELFVDRQNLVNTLKDKYIEWQQNNKYNGANQDLWIQVFQEIQRRPKMTLKVRWIRGHQNLDSIDVIGNTIADNLASYKEFTEYELDTIL